MGDITTNVDTILSFYYVIILGCDIIKVRVRSMVYEK